jgi:hypothetical protein
VILGQPLAHIRWQQERLLSIARNKALAHDGRVLT